MEVKCDDIEEDDDDIKVILVGEMGTGKTSLINTSIGLEFKDKLETTKTSSILNKTIKIIKELLKTKISISSFYRI